MPAPLPPPIDPEPQPGDELFSPEILAEITNQEQKHGIYTAARFEKLRPEQAKACVKFLADGMAAQEIARALNVSDRTVTAMADKHADEITDLEKHLGKKARRCAHYLLERVERNPGIIPAQAIGQTVRQFYEVGQLADGRPTEIIEETKRVDIYEHWQRFVAGDEIGLSGGKIPVRDAELVDSSTSSAAALEDRTPDQDAEPKSALQSDVLGLVAQEETGLATPLATPPGPEGAAIEPTAPHTEPMQPMAGGRGGGRTSPTPGGVANDNGSRKFYANGAE